MVNEDSPLIIQLKTELRVAHESGVLPYYHLGRCDFPQSHDTFCLDLYLALKIEHIVKEDDVKHYLRSKYGAILRAISVNTYY